MTPQEAVDLLVSQFGDCFDRHAKMFFAQDALQYIRDVAQEARQDALEWAALAVINYDGNAIVDSKTLSEAAKTIRALKDK